MWLTLAVLLCFSPLSAVGNLIPNGDFEEELQGWNVTLGGEASVIIRAKSAHGGTLGLLVRDPGDGNFVRLCSVRFEVVPGKNYLVRFWARMMSGSGIAVLVRFYDAEGELLELDNAKKRRIEIPPGTRRWREFELHAPAPVRAARMEVMIRSNIRASVRAEFDEFRAEILHRPQASPVPSATPETRSIEELLRG